MDNETRIQRMLKQFESQLPEHEIGKWFFEIDPHNISVLDERGVHSIKGGMGIGILIGCGSCTRCGQQFELERRSNYSVYSETDQQTFAAEFSTLTTVARVESAKKDLQKNAERAGKCWGDIPRIENNKCFVTMD